MFSSFFYIRFLLLYCGIKYILSFLFLCVLWESKTFKIQKSICLKILGFYESIFLGNLKSICLKILGFLKVKSLGISEFDFSENSEIVFSENFGISESEKLGNSRINFLESI